DLTKLSQAHSSYVWRTSETWPKRDPLGPHLTRSHVWPTSKTWPKSDQPSPDLFPSSLKQTWNKLDHASTSSKSQSKLILQAPKFDPRFRGSKNVTSSLATPRSCLSHISLKTPMQASHAPPHSSKVTFGPSPRLGPNVTHLLKAQDLQQFFPTLSNFNSS
ncbi:hypothetical protein PIB30_102219, partial [Stylosanthes scabra]|nr:hypothetical protein [Stylosanthes scabra]